MNTRPMAADYLRAIQTCLEIALQLSTMNIPQWLLAIEDAFELLPTLDPPMSVDEVLAMREHEKTLKAALPLHELGIQLREQAEERAMQEKREGQH